MSKRVTLCLIVSAVIILLHSYSTTHAQILQNAEYKEGELIVRFAPKANGVQRILQEKNAVLSLFNGGTVTHSYKLVPGLTLVKLPKGSKVKDAISLFKNRLELLYVEPNYELYLHSAFPNDSRFTDQWNLHNAGQNHSKDGGGITFGTPDADIDALEAWSLSYDSDIVVAVLDSGIDYTHPDLTSNMWRNYDEWNGESNTDDDGNTLNDDIYGDDTTYGGDNDPLDIDSHGTHCAGIIGAQGNNNEGVSGVCWNVPIMALQIFPGPSESTFVSQVILAIDYAVEMGAKILSNSWGGVFQYYQSIQSLKEEIEAADNAGVLFIASAGNDGWDLDNEFFPQHYPSEYDCNNIIAVTATDHNDERSVHESWESNWGETSVDLSAPGSDILSTFPSYKTSAMQGLSTYYETIGGTSMSCPHVAAACALVWAANPTLTHLEVKQIILDSVDPLDSLDGKCVTGGRLNLEKALDLAMPLKIKLYSDRESTYCMLADPNIFYTITYANPSDPNYAGEVSDCTIVHYLPDGIDPNFVVASDNGIFDPNDNTVTWTINDLSPGDVDLVTLIVRMEEFTQPPLGRIWSKAVLYSDSVNPIASVDVADLHPFQLTVDDGVDETGVDVRGEIKYTLNWKYLWNDPNDPDASKTLIDPRKLRDPQEPNTRIHPDNLKIIAYLPPELGPVYIGSDPNWVVVWEFDPNFLAQDRQDTVELTAPVNNLVEPGSTITTRFKLFYTIDTIQRFAILDVDTEVCDCSEAKIIYVDHTAYDGDEDGSSWEDAFIYLDEALAYARACGDQIWIAAGTYNPDGYSDPNATFKLVNNVAVYGGFPSGGGDWQDRNWLDNETILSGDVSGGMYSVVTAENIDSAILDGFTISDGLVEGILCSNASPTIEHNRIKQNGWGIFSKGNNSAPTIKNNWIYQNAEDGIYLENGNTTTLIRNNTIADNAAHGIYVDAGSSPDIRNCILWGHPDPNDVQGCSTQYCIVQEDGDSNPDFLTGTDNYHIDTDSPCVDEGDPNEYYSAERDIDGQFRVINNRVDIGADETCVDSYFSPADFNSDNIVNLEDYQELAVVWLEDTPPWDPNCDLNADDTIDLYDLNLFTDDWLWFSCSYNSPQPNMMMGRGGSGMKSMSLEVQSSLTPTSSLSKTKPLEIAHAVPEKMTLQKMVELIRWLDEIWLEEPEIRKEISQEEWKEFMRRVYLSFDYLE